MKTKIMYALPIALMGLLASQASFAGYPDKTNIAEQFTRAASELNSIASSKHPDRCSGDIQVAATYLSAAAIKVRHERYDEALMSAHYGDNELRGIAYSRGYCSHFSARVKPYLAQVIQTTSELAVLERIKA